MITCTSTKQASPGDAEHGVVRAGSGRVKGWYLGVRAGRLVLTREPAQTVEARRIYSHK